MAVEQLSEVCFSTEERGGNKSDGAKAKSNRDAGGMSPHLYKERKGGPATAAGAFFRSPSAIALADQAKSFGKQIQNAGQKANDGWTWADNAALDWERDFMSEETKQLKELLDSGAEGLIQAADFIESNLPELETDITLIIP